MLILALFSACGDVMYVRSDDRAEFREIANCLPGAIVAMAMSANMDMIPTAIRTSSNEKPADFLDIVSDTR